ncbi:MULTISPECIES: TIGR03915 family putative DNA repair protein [Acinetobacter]|uniref:TIGR03915 family putative DNA repair protein n=1 Tax=Acinetobacter TaxID=469 RepID=UPI000EC2B898|nr:MULTISPECIES: TIGR03915 family putative DNA repair protein [Acinetobacter]QKW82718.1 TIGR03915 family putative DNA repair protein [Acinetobacter sp. FDAARGOS_724]HAB44552.1 DNA metabolism protein [Acinetobacter sp.]
MAHYCFDGTMTGLLSCVFRAFEFKEFDVKVTANPQAQNGLFDDFIHVASNESQGQRVWQGLKQKVSSSSLKAFYYAFLSEKEQAFQNLFDFAVYVFQNQRPVDKDYGHHAVIGMSQWCKQVGREKHRMEAFVRFKKAKDGLFLSLVKPDFNVLPIISRHFKERYQDQRWLIYDEQRQYGIYYDLDDVHQIEMNAEIVDPQIRIGHSQSFSIELDDEEVLYDQLWKDYFKSVNIQARQNMKLHIQYVPKRYWRYMNEKVL